jgi:hypothetical protein
MVTDLHVAVNNIKVFRVVKETQQWVTFPLLSSCKIFHTNVNSKCTQVFIYSVLYFCLILTKFGAFSVDFLRNPQ